MQSSKCLYSFVTSMTRSKNTEFLPIILFKKHRASNLKFVKIGDGKNPQFLKKMAKYKTFKIKIPVKQV